KSVEPHRDERSLDIRQSLQWNNGNQEDTSGRSEEEVAQESGLGGNVLEFEIIRDCHTHVAAHLVFPSERGSGAELGC
ncbi:MAG: hypothetical protein JXR96_19990, partial [Deltaproteobacteria bacterium]|nr:hypothetical protein [Deltaproteobacteria bacterium]